MKRQRIGFIGGGNMATSLIAGLVADGYEPSHLILSEPDGLRRDALVGRFGIGVGQDNRDAARQADILVLCVKPQVARGICEELAATVQERRPLVISIMAGIRLDLLQRWLGAGLALVRSMPNTPAMLQAGATALYAGTAVTPAQRNQAESILRAVGLTCWVAEEGAMDTVTALSGSGPAYFFLVMESLEQAAIELGLAAETARLLTLQTALGAARMAVESSEPPRGLRQRVTSPGGTTERAVATLEAGGLRELFARALHNAHNRSVELSSLLSDNDG